ncbi:MAG: DNA recombination protein RmuC [Pseudomonadota bacterium]
MSYDMNKLKLDFDIEMRMKNEYLSCLNKEKEKNQVLISDNIRLKAYNQVLEKQNMSLTNFTDNIADRTKKHFFDLGKSLTTQLIDLQRKESVAQRDEANNVINKSIKHITDRFDTVNQYVANLHNQLKASQDNFNKITDNILNPIKIQNLTEITLENILNASGIKKGYDFFIQPVIRSDNNILRPDALVKLPGDKILLIDAKSFSPNTDDLCRSMHTHLKQLSEKDYLNKALEYFNLSNVKSHMIAMFVASDSILDKVMNEDKDFLNKAWKKNIFPVGPTGLMNLLVMSKYSIDGYERDKNQEVIIEEVIKLLNSIFILFEHTKKSSRSLNAFNNNFNKIVACMNSSVFNSMNRISKLGLNHNKNLDALDKIPVNISYQFDDEVKQNYNF